MALERFVSRASLGWGATPAGRTITNLGTIAHYDSGFRLRNFVRASGHDGCYEYWRTTRTMHKGQNWVDIGYAYFACPHDYIFAGREVNHQQAAEMPTPGKLQNGNSRYVSCTFGLGPGEEPTEGALNAWARLREWLMDEHGVKANVYGHRDFTSTDCPGEPVYRRVLNGSLKRAPKDVGKPDTKPPTVPPTPPVQEDFDMDYASFGASEAGPTECAPNTWVDVKFDTEYADPTKSHPDAGSNPTVLVGKPFVYALEFGAEIVGAQPGDVVDVDTSEYLFDKTTTPHSDKLVETGKPANLVLTDSLRLHYTAVGSLRKNGKLRIRVRSHATSPVKVTNARISVAFST